MSESSQEQNTSEANEEGASSSTTGKTCSNVWVYFTRVPIGPDGVARANCNSCEATYTTRSGTTNMIQHMSKCFDLSDVSGPPQKRVRLDRKVFKKKIAISIIKHNYPFSYVEHDATRELHRFLHPDAKPMARNTAKKEVFKIYKIEKMKLKDKLEKVTSRICLTSDLWTSVTTDGYMTLTAHYIDEGWVLRKQVLNFRVVHLPHSGLILAECINNFLKDWGIEKKVFTITLDNAAYNNGVVECLKDHLRLNDALVCDGEYLHVRCGAHILNLIVQSGLKVIEGAIEKVQNLSNLLEQVQMELYLSNDCALVYERAYTRLKLVDFSYKTCPTEEEWERIRAITKILKPFYDITTLFSGTSYPTSNLYFHNVWKIQLHIQEATNSWDPVISGMAKEMKTKFEKYWDAYSMILSFAIILDPRYKMKIVEYCFDKLGMVGEMLSDQVGSIESGLRNLYNGYKSKVHADAMHDLNLGVKEKSQLDKYLEEPPLDRFKHPDLNILQYWKENQGRYPELALMDHDILSSLLSDNVEALLCTRDWIFDQDGEGKDILKMKKEIDERLIKDIEKLI
ncbi:zinc finger BED domain-containing protein RICESLEEPER 2-like protein [Tanacetum coccineum]